MPPGAANLPDPRLGDARRANFEALYERHSREVWAQAYARWLDTDLAMDIVQEAYLRLWKHWERGEEEIQNPRAWLLRVARNLAEDYVKSAFRRHGTQPQELLDSVQTQQIRPDEHLERSELFGRVREVLAELPPADREILTLRYALDYETEAIAEVLGTNVTAIHMRLSRARQRLAELFARCGDFAAYSSSSREPRP